MALIAKKSESNFELCPEGVHHAVCIRVIDLGTHWNEKYKSEQAKVHIEWELPFTFTEEGEPFTVFTHYANYLSEKSRLAKAIVAWRGRAFTEGEMEGYDLTKLLGQNCQLQIIHNKVGEKTYANVESIMKLANGVNPIKSKNAPQSYDIDSAIPEWMPDWLADKINKSIEKTQAKKEASKPPVETSDIEPF